MTRVKVVSAPIRYDGARMNTKRLALLSLLASALALGLAGCGGSNDTPAPAAKPGDGRPIMITSNDKMIYSVVEIKAKPGEKLSVTLMNTGSMPKQSMGHNWVLLQQGTNLTEFMNAAAQATATEYIPGKFKDAIVAHTRLLGPKESDTVTFNAPTTPGRHLFVCSFPGHQQVGMKGVLVVE